MMPQLDLGGGLWTAGRCAALCVVLGAGSAAAETVSTGCVAANRGVLNMRAAAGGNAWREATFDGGDRLTIALSTPGTAAVTVSDPGGEARTLHSGRATSMTFVAPGKASLGFRLDADAESNAAIDIKCTPGARANAERALADRRRAFLASRDPDRIRIDRAPTEAKAIDSFTPSVTDSALPREMTASISLSELTAAMGQKGQPTTFDFWFEGRHETYDTVDMDARRNDGNFASVTFGSHYRLGPDIMLGYLAQFDQLGEYSRYSGGVSTKGWMAGPYMSVRFGHGVILDARAARGTTELAPDGVMLDTVPADRILVRSTLRGERQLAGWTLAPSVGLSYVEDIPKFRNTAFSEATPVGTGRLDMLPEVKRRFDLDSSTYIEPRLAAGGFLSFDDISRLAPGGVAAAAPDLHWKAEAGVALGVKDSMSLQATGGVETGGQSAADTWSGRLRLNVPLGE